MGSICKLVLVLCMTWVQTLAEDIILWGPQDQTRGDGTRDDILRESSYMCYTDANGGGMDRLVVAKATCDSKYIDPENDEPYSTAARLFGMEAADRDIPQNLCDCRHWHKIASAGSGQVFPERNGHATTVFKKRIWLTGGRSKLYSRWDNGQSQRRADVWSSPDGQTWTQEMLLLGDFEEQNTDVLIPGPVAPWWERFGHTMDTYHATKLKRDGTVDEEIAEVILLFGGFAPNPMNDLWVTQDGITWNMVFKEPYYDTPQINKWPSPRGFHGSAIFNNSLWIVSGSPLNNEVWSAKDLTLSPQLPLGAIQGRKPIWWTIKWDRHFSISTVETSTSGSYLMTDVPFMPRAGAMIASQPVYQGFTHWGDNWGGDNTTDHPDQTGEGIYNYSKIVEYLYVAGGFGAWHESDPNYDGERARNDVWRTSNGYDWVRLDVLEHAIGAEREPPQHTIEDGVPRGYVKKSTAGAPWAARAFGSMITWRMDTSYSDAFEQNLPQSVAAEPYMDVTEAANFDAEFMYRTNKGLPFYYDRMKEFDRLSPVPPRTRRESLLRKTRSEQIRTRWEKDGTYWAPRIWLSGGGYFGRKGNNAVQTMEAYVDLWWTRDGVKWFQVVETKGSGNSLYSSSECFFTEETQRPLYIGKYGHTMAALTPKDSYIPGLFLIAGDMVDDGPIVSDTFQNANGILCDIYDPGSAGVGGAGTEAQGFLTCNGHGVCDRILPFSFVRDGYYYERGVERIAQNATLYMRGCRCDAGWTGEYCEGKDPTVMSAAPAVSAGAFSFLLPAAATSVLLLLHFGESWHRQRRKAA